MIDYRFKILVTGMAGVGKTSLIRRYVDDKFDECYIPTMASDFSYKDINYRGKSVRLVLYEMAGHHKYEARQGRHFTGGSYICSVLSLSRDEMDSIKSARALIERVRETWKKANKDNPAIPEGGDVPLVIILNKADLLGDGDASTKRRYRYKLTVSKLTKGIRTDGILFTSAKTGEGIDILFSKLAHELLMASRQPVYNIK